MAPVAVLIIEADATITHLVALVLGEEGYAVACAASPTEALALLAVRGPAVRGPAVRGPAAFAVILGNPCARPLGDPYAPLDRLHTRTEAPIVICTRDRAATDADHQARGYAAVVEESCDLRDLPDAAARARSHACRGLRGGYALLRRA